jgi:hypothetical protein
MKYKDWEISHSGISKTTINQEILLVIEIVYLCPTFMVTKSAPTGIVGTAAAGGR